MRGTRVVAWNIRAGGGRRVGAIAAALLDRTPDVVALGEFHANRAGGELCHLLERGGLVYQAQGSCLPDVRSVLLASRDPFVVEPFPEWPANQAFRVVTGAFPTLRVIGVYFPSRAPHIARMFAPLQAATPRLRAKPTLLVGDLNAGLNPGDTEGSPLSASPALARLHDSGWTDLWRRSNPTAHEYTWYSPGPRNGFRLDHALLTGEGVDVTDCRYDHQVREAGLSDHSLLELTVVRREGA